MKDFPRTDWIRLDVEGANRKSLVASGHSSAHSLQGLAGVSGPGVQNDKWDP